MSDVEGWEGKCGLPDVQHLAAHAWGPSFIAATVWDRSRVVSGSVAVAVEVEQGAAIASPVADASAALVAAVLGAGAADALSTFDGGLGLGADGLAEVAVAQGGGAAGELVHWCVPFWRSPRVVPVRGCGVRG